MGWSIEYWDGIAWVTKADAVLSKITQELNGHEEAIFTVPNTSSNRTFVSSDTRVRIKFDTTVLFDGKMYGALYSVAHLLCYVYYEAYEKLKSKTISGTYSTSTDIATAIQTASGVTMNVPSADVSVRFNRTPCYKTAVWLAKALNKDFWADYDATPNPRFNIGDRTNSAPYPSITPISWPERGIDRAKKRDKVIVVWKDDSGVEQEAVAGTGTNVEVIRDLNVRDATSAANIAQQKLTELNKESSGVALSIVITEAYNLFPGYYVTLNKTELNLVGDFRIWKITKDVSIGTIEVDKAQEILDKRLKETEKYEDYGIYTFVNLDTVPGPPATPTGLVATAKQGAIELKWTANTEADMDRYIIFKGTTADPTTEYARSDVNYFLDTGVTYGTNYYYRLKAVDRAGNVSGYSTGVGPVSPLYVENPDVPPVTVPTISATAYEVDTAAEFRTWVEFTITRQESAGGYVIGYRKQGDSQWIHIYVEQPASGNPVAQTPDLLANTIYEYHACAASKLGQVSSWSIIAEIATLANETAPPTPSGLSATALLNAVLIEWQHVGALDLSHYQVYRSITSNPGDAVSVGTTRGNVLIWKVQDPTADYITHYFWVTAIDNANNESAKQVSPVSAIPIKASAYDIAPNAVEAQHILEGAVEEAKIATGAVTETKIATDAVVASKIKDAEVLWDKLSADTQQEILQKAVWFSEGEQNFNLSSGTTIVSDATASNGQCIRRLSSESSGGMWFGPYITLNGGNYWVLYRMKVANNTNSSNLIKIDVYVNGSTRSSRQLHATDFEQANVWQTFAVPAEIRQNDTNIEFRGGEFVSGITDVYMDYVAVIPMAKVSTDCIEAYAITAGKIAAGAVTSEKLTVYSIFLDGFTWYNNTPSAGNVKWTAGTLQYGGVTYNIQEGYTTDKFIWWEKPNTTFSHDSTKPSWSPTRYFIAVNENGTYTLVWNATYIHGGTLITGTITAQEIKAGSISSDRILTSTITGSEADRIFTDEELLRVVSIGGSSTTHPIQRGLYAGRTNTLIARAGRSYMLSIYNRDTQAWVSHTTYDVFGNIANADAMANALNALGSNRIVIIHTYDEPRDNRFGTDNSLLDAMIRCGATNAVFGANNDKFRWQSAYILIGIPGMGEGNGIELYSGLVNSDTDAWCETSFAIQNGNLTQVSKTRTLNLSADVIVLSGTTYLTSWQKTEDVTKIDGGKIYASSVSVSKLAADALGRMFDAESIKAAIQNWRHPSDLTLIDGGDIYTDTIHTAKIHFDPFATRPTLREGLLYWYTGADSLPGGQLEFASGTLLSDIAMIPKYPLYDVQAPPENMIPNQSFEFDRDGDGVPDGWTKLIEAGAPVFWQSTATSWKGQHSACIYAATTDKGCIYVWIPAEGSKKYYFAVDVYSTGAGTFGRSIGTVEFWNANKSTNLGGTLTLGTSVSAGWNHPSTSGVSLADTRWARVCLYNYLPSAAVYLYFDNVVFSEMRAAVPTTGVVAASSSPGIWNAVNLSGTVNVYSDVCDITPTVDTELYVINVFLLLNQDITSWVDVRVRVKNVTDSEYYPNETVTPIVGFKNYGRSMSTVITIPKNVKNKTLRIQVAPQDTESVSKQILVSYASWGHSPHMHR